MRRWEVEPVREWEKAEDERFFEPGRGKMYVLRVAGFILPKLLKKI